MNKISKKLAEAWDNSGLTVAQLSAKSGVPDTTLRRLRTAESGINSDTVIDVAKALDISLDELFGLNPPRMAEPAAVQPAPDNRLVQMYEVRIDELKELYERAITAGKKRERVKTIAIIVLSIILAVYFLYFDVRNGSWGFVTYSSGIYSQNIPDTTSM